MCILLAIYYVRIPIWVANSDMCIYIYIYIYICISLYTSGAESKKKKRHEEQDQLPVALQPGMAATSGQGREDPRREWQMLWGWQGSSFAINSKVTNLGTSHLPVGNLKQHEKKLKQTFGRTKQHKRPACSGRLLRF